MKKSQVVLEFLTTYGWAIFIVLVAFGALAYFGVLSPCNFNKNIEGCKKKFNPEIHECDEWQYKCAEGDLQYDNGNCEIDIINGIPFIFDFENNECLKFHKKTTRAEMDSKASTLCNNLRVNGKIYPEYREYIDLMRNSTPKGWIYIPESPNIIENKPRLLRTGIEANPYKWNGNLSEINNVFCLIPSEICFPIVGNITECGQYQDRMEFDYKRWGDWYEQTRQ